MFADDSVYVRCLNLPSNSYETLRGAQTNIMAVIPLYSGAGSDNFHSPEYPTSAIIGKMGISDIDVRLTDAMGEMMDLNGVEWEFQMTFEVFPETTKKHSLAFDMQGSHARESAPQTNWRYQNNIWLRCVWFQNYYVRCIITHLSTVFLLCQLSHRIADTKVAVSPSPFPVHAVA